MRSKRWAWVGALLWSAATVASAQHGEAAGGETPGAAAPQQEAADGASTGQGGAAGASEPVEEPSAASPTGPGEADGDDGTEAGAPAAGEGEGPAARWGVRGEEEAPEPESSSEGDGEPERPVGPGEERAAGEGAASGGEGADTGIPVRMQWHGYYRARLVWTGGVPLPSDSPVVQEAGEAHYAYQRLRLAPSVLYGSDEERPVVALRMQFDGLDNVVFGDNSRVASTPLFAEEPSVTGLDGFELGDTFELKRVWLEFLIPVGQLRIGRMPSHWGLGILAHGGEGLGEWGDPETQATFDRILFATRPLTIVNAISRGDARPTPLITAVAFDKLVEDPVRDSIDAPSRLALGPLDARFEDRRALPPYAFLTNGADDVQELIGVLLWRDPDWDPVRESDELSFGYYFIYRWQQSTRSDVYIHSLAWDVQRGLRGSPVSLFSEGELVGIFGSSRGIKLGGSCTDTDGDGETDLCGRVEASILGGVVRAGATDERTWRLTLEAGYSEGDPDLTRIPNAQLTSRALHSAYRVGLLLYRVALAGKAALALGQDLSALWPRGGVWNSRYLWPTFRYTPIPGVHLDAGVLLAWADELDGLVYVLPEGGREERTCGLLDGDCFLGWELDLAARFRWGEEDRMLWDWEFAVMRAGRALSQPDRGRGLSEPWLWTLQSRVGFQF